MKVLICDDSMTMRRIILNSLKKLGIDIVIEAESGEEAYNELKRNLDANLVILDWNMPGWNGYTTLQKIKSDPATFHIPVLMATSESEKTQVVKAIQAGASNYIVKPFKPMAFEKKVCDILRIKYMAVD